MGNSNELLGTVGVIFLWPLAVIASIALIACGLYTDAEYEDGALTLGGKRMVRSRIALGAGCGIYCLCLLASVALKGENSSAFAFWPMHWQALLIAMAGANVSFLLAAVFGFQARGSGRLIMRISTACLAIASTATTLMLISKVASG